MIDDTEDDEGHKGESESDDDRTEEKKDKVWYFEYQRSRGWRTSWRRDRDGEGCVLDECRWRDCPKRGVRTRWPTNSPRGSRVENGEWTRRWWTVVGTLTVLSRCRSSLAVLQIEGEDEGGEGEGCAGNTTWVQLVPGWAGNLAIPRDVPTALFGMSRSAAHICRTTQKLIQVELGRRVLPAGKGTWKCGMRNLPRLHAWGKQTVAGYAGVRMVEMAAAHGTDIARNGPDLGGENSNQVPQGFNWWSGLLEGRPVHSCSASSSNHPPGMDVCSVGIL
ncbi:hypothetical protein DFH08DRAFT_818402 [Mycena albidolilacea]|uniref:Uncharacterized protein n=1 Tax=Mycena albidolilacea TaxID=1033008 RepID=A0AAD6ZFZ4_9AGAR|nr:hypothetical protein DFH08DRAFT_818402 [Mycena albidolilacea]